MLANLAGVSVTRARPGDEPGRAFSCLRPRAVNAAVACRESTRPGRVFARAAARWARDTALVLILALAHAGLAAATTPPGTVIANTASLSYQAPDGSTRTEPSNTVSATVVPANVIPPSVSFIALEPGSPAATNLVVGETQCSVNGGASFTSLPNPPGTGGSPNSGTALPLAPTTMYSVDDTLFIELSAPGLNSNPAVRGTATVTVSAGGQTLTLELTETTPGSGVFVGDVPTSGTPANGCVLQAGPNAQVRLSYIDPQDAAATAAATALIAPYDVVFDSSSGKPVNGVQLTLVNATTGQPAEVFGKDGVSRYPATVTSGTAVTDSSGAIYSVPAGGFVFPMVEPGTYRIEVKTPAGYHAPSVVSPSELQTLPGAPYTLPSIAFGGTVNVTQAGLLRFDVPVDPVATTLFLQKTASQPEAAIGDMMQFTLTLQNTSPTLAAEGVSLLDTLPLGFRYVSGSARLGDGTSVNPTVSSNGQQLSFDVGSVLKSSSATVTYVVELTAATPLTLAVNSAQALESGISASNIATAQVQVQSDFLQNVNTLIGRVVVGCNSQGPQGIANARVVMEDGRYVITDKHGDYHFQAISNGTHVVQLDLTSLPPGYEPLDCGQNTRTAGRDFSQFVEVHGGALWRADFHVQKIPGRQGVLSLQLLQAPAAGHLHNIVALAVTKVAVADLSVTIILPQGMSYVDGTAQLNGAKIPDPAESDGFLVFRLGSRAAGWKGALEFDARLSLGQSRAAATPANAVLQTQAFANFDSPTAKSQRTPVAAVILQVRPQRQAYTRSSTLSGFASGSADLTDQNRKLVQQIIQLLQSADDVSLTFSGYTDDWPLIRGSRYANNMALSIARANAAAEYVRAHMDTNGVQIFITGHGKGDPLATNTTADGRSLNRRVVVQLAYDLAVPAVAAASGESAVQRAVVQGLSPADLAGIPASRVPSAGPAATTDKQKLADTFKVDPKWLAAQTHGTPQFIWPTRTFLPALPAIHVAVEHSVREQAGLLVNGKPVDGANFVGVMKNSQGTAAVSQWMGVPLVEGDNTLVAVITEGGRVVQRLTQTVHYSGVPVRAEFMADKSSLLADGRSQPVFAVRFLDRWGYPARRGLAGHYQVGAPYQAYQSVAQLQQDQDTAIHPREPTFVIGEDGLAYLKLAPTTVTGNVTVTVPLQQGSAQLHGWLRPAARDWILVGVATGTAAFNKIKDHMQLIQGDDPNSDIYQDGRVAFYAKGMIKGGYLLTTAYDSAKNTGASGGTAINGLQQAVNPNTYFMLYGDASQQGFDASSVASKLYIKIERNQFYAMFGDFTTGLTVTELSRYDRMFNGVKSAYQGERFGYTAFAAQNAQGYVKDEIQGNGTSGLYHLSHQQLLIYSDRVSIQIRDRYTNAVISTQQLTPFVDYTINYFAGTIYFKQPVSAYDQNFDPEYIVAEYEVANGAGNAITGGGRASMKFAGGRAEVGITGINEGTGDGNNRLTGVDLAAQLSPSTVLKAEVAHTANGPNGALGTMSNLSGTGVVSGVSNTSNSSGNAYRVELKTASPLLENDLFLNDEAATFGLGQQSLGNQGMRRAGDTGRYLLDKYWSVTGNILTIQSLTQGTTNDMANAGVQYKSADGNTLGAGLQHTQSTYPELTPTLFGGDAQGDFSSNQVLVNGSYGVLHRKVIVHGNAQVGVGSGSNDPQYPNLADLGVDYKLTPKVTLFGDQQIASSGGQSAQITSAGVKTQPWEHGEMDESMSAQSTEYGERLFSTMGLTQGWQVNKDLSLQAGYNRVATMRAPATSVPGALSHPAPALAAVPAFGALTQDFNSLFVGGSYHKEQWAMNGRVEVMNSAQQTSRSLFGGFYRALAEGEAFSASLQAFHSDYSGTGVSANVTGRLGYAFRADNSCWSWLEQLDFIYATQEGLQTLAQFANPTGIAASQESASTLANNLQTVSTYGLNMRNWKLVNNLQANYTLPGYYQLSLYYGSKFVRYAFDTGNYHGYTDLVGAEFRYDLSAKHDLGFVMSRLHTWNSDTFSNQVGVETGWTVGTNMWLSVGYNFIGFYDEDFTASHYTAQGLFLRFRFKFDQDTVKAMAQPGNLLPP
ncbi:MAG: OmpA family protein [Gammaproteobacteria bacterium]